MKSLFSLSPNLILALTLLLAGCKTIEQKQSSIDLENTLYSYHTIVRWSHPSESYSFLKPGVLVDEEIPANLDNVRVIGYEIIRPPVPLDEGLVEQIARISYVLKDRQIQRTLNDTQVWEYNEEERIWLRINPPPRYK